MAPMDSDELKDELRRRSGIDGGGLLPLGGYGATPHTSWILRRHDAHIRLLRSSEETVYELRAGDWRIKAKRSNVTVQVVAMALGFGFRPFDEDDISVSFVDEHAEVEMGLLENLTLQDEIPFFLLGDSSNADLSGMMNNVHRDWAKKALATIEAMPAWNERDFKHARAKLQGRFSTKLEFWNHLGQPPS